MIPAISLQGVSNQYDAFALQDVDLLLPEGQVMGLIGVNGAGKSTSLRLLMGLIRADRGEVRVFGQALPDAQVAVKRDIGYASDDMRLYPGQSLRWHMDLVRRVYPRWDEAYATHLMQRFQLRPAQTLGGFSHGQRVKALLLLLLARHPRLLLLDEPTTGLDPVARMFVRVLVVTAFLDLGVAEILAVPLGLMGAVMLAGAGWKFLELRRASPGEGAGDPGEAVLLANPFALVPAIKWGAVLSAVLVAMAVARQYFGAQGLYVAAAAAGVADVDAVTIAVSRQSQEGTLAVAAASLAVTIAVVSNMVMKGTMAVGLGRAGYGRPIALVFAVAVAVGVVAALAR